MNVISFVFRVNRSNYGNIITRSDQRINKIFMVMSGRFQSKEKFFGLSYLASHLQLGFEKIKAMDAIGEVKLGDDNVPQKIDYHSRMIVFSYVNGCIKDLSRLIGSQYIPVIVNIIKDRLKYRFRHSYTSRRHWLS